MTFKCAYQPCSNKKNHGHGYCATHYRQKFVLKQELKDIKKKVHLAGQECNLDFCNNQAVAKDLCSSHYAQVFKYGIEPRPLGQKEICEAYWCNREYRSGSGRRLCKECSSRRKKYEISIDEFIVLPDSCQICGSNDRLCIDHCHDTNIVRGILCSKCNTGIGMFYDNVNLVSMAVKYLVENNV